MGGKAQKGSEGRGRRERDPLGSTNERNKKGTSAKRKDAPKVRGIQAVPEMA